MASGQSSNPGLVPGGPNHEQPEFTFFSGRTLQYYHFNARLGNPDWTGKKILDFGGNVGGFLIDAPPAICKEDYWCVDLHKPALERGQRTFPQAHFVFYNRYHGLYNPTGIVGLPVPDLDQTFDFILAFSVFTYTTVGEMLDLVPQLNAMLRRGGILAFTFGDPHYDPLEDPQYDMTVTDGEVGWGPNLKHRLLREKPAYPEIDVVAYILQVRNARWCTLIGNHLIIEDAPFTNHEPGVCYHVFHTVDFIRQLFPQAQICAPLSPLRQHWCILRK
jgi:SAM-dependent methyltransferase